MDESVVRDVLAPFLHRAQLANAVTSFVTCMAGILPLWFTLLLGRHPTRWMFVYFCIVLTAIPTVWFHAYEDNSVAQTTDTASNILLAWAMLVAVTGDFSNPRNRILLVGTASLLNLLLFAYMLYETVSGTKDALVTFGDGGFLYASEVGLIVNSLVVAAVFSIHTRKVPPRARPLLGTVLFMFVCGAVLATKEGDYVTMRIVAWHATWHIVSGFALVTLWLFNHVRFVEEAARTRETGHVGA